MIKNVPYFISIFGNLSILGCRSPNWVLVDLTQAPHHARVKMLPEKNFQ